MATVFISSKSEDYPAAREVYQMLQAAGVVCFFSEVSLPAIGRAEYKAVIDRELDEATHLVLVTSCLAHAQSEWVKYEWNSFDGEILARRKQGNIVSVLCAGMTASELPYALRRYEAVLFPSQLDKLPRYLGHHSAPSIMEPLPAAVPEAKSEVMPSAEAMRMPPEKFQADLPVMDDAGGNGSATPALSPKRWFLMWLICGLVVMGMNGGLTSFEMSRGEAGMPLDRGVSMLFNLGMSVVWSFTTWWLLRRVWHVSWYWLLIKPLAFAAYFMIWQAPWTDVGSVLDWIRRSMTGEGGLDHAAFGYTLAGVSLVHWLVFATVPQAWLLKRHMGAWWTWWYGQYLLGWVAGRLVGGLMSFGGGGLVGNSFVSPLVGWLCMAGCCCRVLQRQQAAGCRV